MIDNNVIKQVIQPLLLRASNAILDLTDGITATRPINIKKALDEALNVRAELFTMWGQLNAGAVPTVIESLLGEPPTITEDPSQLRRLDLLQWLMGLNPMKPMGKCKVDPDSGKMELVFHWGSSIYHVTPDVVTINANEEINPPSWMLTILELLRETYGHANWSFVSGSHFLSLAGPVLRGSPV
jgi:hypothetical protein